MTASDADDRLVGVVAGTDEVRAATGDAAWLAAMLDVERALTTAAGRLGLVDRAAAAEVVRQCDPDRFDVGELAAALAADATPVTALVRRLRALVPQHAQPAVHPAATSQDVLDTAMALVARRALEPVLADAGEVAGLLAGLARGHRDSPQLGRTLGQHAAVTSYGAACAARLAGLDEARAGLARVRDERLAVQLGGAVGTLAGAGGTGPALVAAVAAELGLAEPVVAWHSSRLRVGELAGAVGVLAGELAGVALDLVLLSGSDVGELSPARPGGSSAMPGKQNPAAAVLALAAAHRVPGLVATVLAGMPQELQRATGRWQAEPATLVDLLRATAATARHTRDALRGLRVHAEVMDQAVRRFLAGADAPPDVDPARGPADQPAAQLAAQLAAAGRVVDRVLEVHAGPPEVGR